MRPRHRVRAVATLACATSIVVAGEARATGYELREQSAVGQGTSFAGAAARNDDPTMLFFNPASMAGVPGIQGAIVGSGVFPRAEATSGTATRNVALGGSPITGSLGGDLALDAFVPALYGTVALGSDVRVGLSVNAPWGLVTKYPFDFIGRYHALTSSLRTVNVAPAVSWQATPTLSFGAALQVQYASARLSSAVDFGAIGAASRLPFVPGSRDGLSTVNGHDTAIGYVVGAQWEPLAGTRLGVSFRSAVFHEITGDATFEGVPFPLSLSPNFQGTTARAKLTTPETVTVGLSQRIGERWTVLAGLEWTNWSRFRDLIIDFDNGRPPSVTEQRWRDSVFVNIGGEYRWDERLTLRAGFAFDQSPVPDSTRTPRIPDSNRYWLSVGASYAILPGTVLSVGYTHIFAPAARVGLTDPGPDNTNLFRGNLDANYSASVDIVAAQLRFAF
jgi:long-chain fatty acid transport protein